MIEIAYIGFFGVILTFLYNLYLLFTRNESMYAEDSFKRWKIALMVFIISLLAFFIYYGAALNTFTQSTTIEFNDGTPDTTITSNDYLNVLTFFPLVIGCLLMNFVFLATHIFIDFKVFYVRGRMKKNRF